jgi:hypothetical protein
MFRALARTAAQTRPARLSAAPLSVVHARSYHENVIRHYENPRNVRQFAFPNLFPWLSC